MSTMNIETNGNVTTISGPDMTRDFEQIKRECCGRYDNFIFPDAKKVVELLKKQGRSPKTNDEIMDVHLRGSTREYYDKVYCYYCVNKKNYRNYMFSPDDGENKDNHYSRLRANVLNFSVEEDFEVWLIPCA
mgnify:FL=1